MDGQHSKGSWNLESKAIYSTHSIHKGLQTPTEELHPGSLKGRALLKSHSFPEVRDSEPPSW